MKVFLFQFVYSFGFGSFIVGYGNIRACMMLSLFQGLHLTTSNLELGCILDTKLLSPIQQKQVEYFQNPFISYDVTSAAEDISVIKYNCLIDFRKFCYRNYDELQVFVLRHETEGRNKQNRTCALLTQPTETQTYAKKAKKSKDKF